MGGSDSDTSSVSSPGLGVAVMTPDNANELALEYFSVEPYLNIDTGKNDGKGRPIFKRQTTAPRTWDGLAGKYAVPLSILLQWLTKETAELCQSKFKHFLIVNGLTGQYEASPWALVMKNEAGYAEKNETKVRQEMVLSDADRRMLARAGVMTIDATPSVPARVEDSGVTSGVPA